MIITENWLSTERLKTLRKRRKMSIESYSDYLQLSDKKLRDWENHISKPSYIELVKLAAKEHVSIGWLTGRISTEELKMPEEQLKDLEREADEILDLQKICEDAVLKNLYRNKNLANDLELIKNNLKLDKKMIQFCNKLQGSELLG